MSKRYIYLILCVWCACMNYECHRAILDLDMYFPRHPCCWQVPEMSERCSQHSHVWLLLWPFRVRSRVLSQLRRLH